MAMTPALVASIREALGKPYLSEEACRRVAVAVLEGVREPVLSVLLARKALYQRKAARRDWKADNTANAHEMSLYAAEAMDHAESDMAAAIDALLSEIRG